MLLFLTVVSLALLAVLLWSLVHWVGQFTALFAPPTRCSPGNDELPPATVLLPVRGADPSLAHCLSGLLQQNYPRYDVRIIIDSAEDPAWELVQRALADHPTAKVDVSLLEERRQTCSLKLSALVQALGSLDESCGAVVLVDADVEPHPDWLRDLVTPLLDPEVGASTGIRWYMPERPGLGCLVRHLWNATASVVMNALHIPWGGSLAFRTDVIRKAGMADRWARSLFEDVGSYEVIDGLGLKLRVVAEATMINRESADLGGCFRFVRRQLLNARLYHARWPLILAHGIAFTLTPALANVLLVIALAGSSWETASALAVGLALYAYGMRACLLRIERNVRRLARRRGDPVTALTWKTWAAVPLTQAFYLICLLSASCLRKVDWRGITYKLRGPLDVRLLEYRPYRSADRPADRRASLV